MNRVPLGTLAAAALLALALLLAALAWALPMMLWDHLDLVPMLAAGTPGALADAGFWAIHGGHLHSAAYAVLLVTSRLADGAPWPDVLASWLLLVLTAAVVVGCGLRRFGRAPDAPLYLAAVVVLVLHPGHLANLQWGWQVAVFLCLAGVVLALRLLTAPAPTAAGNALALAAAAVALLSFATALALPATAALVLALRRDLPPRRRLALLLPWLLLGAGALAMAWRGGTGGAPAAPVELAHYVLNFLGGALARFATDLAPLLAAISLPVAAAAWLRHPDPAAARFWSGLLLFGLGCALLTALGRTGAYGPEQAFATRYVSFSTLYWLGLVGLLATSRSAAGGGTVQARWHRAGVAGLVVLALATGGHVARKAARLHETTSLTAERIRQDWPEVDQALLADIYFGQAEVARERLAVLAWMGWPPFAAAADRDSRQQP